MFDLAVFADFVGTIALLMVLSTIYGSVHRAVRSHDATQAITGALFGMVAILQMHAPIDIVDGVIFDLRNLPIALAAAFLGPKGALVTLGMAAAMRLHVGGIGAPSGVAAMLSTAIVAFCWQQATMLLPRRNWRHHATLGALVSTSLWAVMLLPADIALSIFASIAPVMVLFYMVFIPVIAAMLEREQVMLRLEAMQTGEKAIDIESGLLNARAFASQVETLRVADAPAGAAAVARVTLRHHSPLVHLWGSESMARAKAALRFRLQGALCHAGIAGVSGDNAIVVPLTRREAETWVELAPKLRLILAGQPLDFGPGGAMTLRIDLEMRPLEEFLLPERSAAVRKAASAGHSALFDGLDRVLRAGRRPHRAG